jgi:putative Mg2+ transporter-C (MgtC) family protein
MNYIAELYNTYTWESQIALATLMGALIGTERELRGKSAGIRTYSIVAMASCLFTILSVNTSGAHDSTRIIGQIVSGIGFLGAGVIWHKDSGTTEGLTTAASLWAVAAIGAAVGVGFIKIAISSSLIVFAIMETFGIVINFIKKIKGVKSE